MIQAPKKAYNMALQKQKADSPLTLRSDELIIKKSRFDELCSIENRYDLLKLEYNILIKRNNGT